MGLEAKIGPGEPLITTDNAGFIRPEANLSLFVSDENDYSPSVHTHIYEHTVTSKEMKHIVTTMVNVSAVVGMEFPRMKENPLVSLRMV